MSDVQEPQADQPKQDQSAMHLGMFANRNVGSAFLSGPEATLAIAALFWVVLVLAIALFAPDPFLGASKIALGVTFLVAVLPVILMAAALNSLRSARLMRTESEQLQATVNAMRLALVQQKQSGVVEMTPNFERKLEEIAAAQRKTEARLARLTTTSPTANDDRSALPQQQASGEGDAPDTEQPSLALGTPSSDLSPPLSMLDFITALNFPDDPDDKAGFNALRRALQDREAAQLISAAQDVLTLLSQDGIYMDDLTPDRARPEIWRRFAKGERGKSIAILGGIRDRSSLALSAGRMRADTIFRDAVHTFLRRFDHTFAEFEKTASDLDIIALSDTRSARAFMLLGRVTGTFD